MCQEWFGPNWGWKLLPLPDPPRWVDNILLLHWTSGDHYWDSDWPRWVMGLPKSLLLLLSQIIQNYNNKSLRMLFWHTVSGHIEFQPEGGLLFRRRPKGVTQIHCSDTHKWSHAQQLLVLFLWNSSLLPSSLTLAPSPCLCPHPHPSSCSCFYFFLNRPKKQQYG